MKNIINHFFGIVIFSSSLLFSSGAYSVENLGREREKPVFLLEDINIKTESLREVLKEAEEKDSSLSKGIDTLMACMESKNILFEIGEIQSSFTKLLTALPKADVEGIDESNFKEVTEKLKKEVPFFSKDMNTVLSCMTSVNGHSDDDTLPILIRILNVFVEKGIVPQTIFVSQEENFIEELNSEFIFTNKKPVAEREELTVGDLYLLFFLLLVPLLPLALALISIGKLH